jgi:hypothetical protein
MAAEMGVKSSTSLLLIAFNLVLGGVAKILYSLASQILKPGVSVEFS